MQIKDILIQFGLKARESEIYLACLELGTTTVNQISRKANIKRTTVYDILAVLISHGLVSQTQKGKKRLFYAEEPEKLYQLLDDKRRQLLNVMPVLKSLHNTAGTKPKIRYYEGKEGLKEVYRDTLSYSGELVAFVTENILKELGEEFATEYTEKRKKAKITVRVIGPDTPDIVEYKKLDKKDFKETRLVDNKKFPFSIELNIYGNRVALMSFREEMGIIIESSEISKNLRLLFELAWLGAKK